MTLIITYFVVTHCNSLRIS